MAKLNQMDFIFIGLMQVCKKLLHMKRKNSLFKRTIKPWFLLVGLCGIVATHAQQITGTVTANGTNLPGASVVLNGQQVTAVSEINGLFTLYNNLLGPQKITLSYVGYEDKTIEIDIKAGINNIGIISMVPANSQLGEVIVRGATAGSQAKALTIKKSSLGIMDVLAADAIGKLPDRNAAEAIQRLPGVSIARDAGEGRYFTVRGVPTQWTASLLNSNRMASASVDFQDRRIQMDIFPSELIQYVQLSKAITPDIEGDNIGGSVNFSTRTSVPKRTLNISAAGGYNSLAQGASYNASIVYGDRILNKKLSFVASAVIWDRPAQINRYDVNYNFQLPDPVQAFSIAEFQLRDYEISRKTIGFNLGAEYAIKPNHKVFFRGLQNSYDDDQMVREHYFNYNNRFVQLQTRRVINKTKLASAEIGGIHSLSNKVKFDWAASYDESSARSTNPETGGLGYPISNYRQPMTFNGLSSDGRMYLRMDSPNGVGGEKDNILPNNATPLNAELLRLNQVIILRVQNNENNRRAGGNLNYKVNEKLNLKFGVKYQHKNKVVDNNPLDVFLAGIFGPAPNMASLNREPYPFRGGFLRNLGSIYDNVIMDHVTSDQVTRLASPEGVTQYRLFPAIRDSATNASGASKFYDGTETVFAGYLMGDYKINNKFTLIAGFRNESNTSIFNGNSVTTKRNPTRTEITPVTTRRDYNAFLPMVHLKYTPTDKDILRMAFTRGFIRPDFNSLNPASIQNDLTLTIVEGNPNLKPTFSNNVDLMYEHYFDDLGLLSAGVFYKDITNFIYNKGSVDTINGLNYLITRPENLDKAWLYGFEAGLQKRFLKLPGFWNGFGVEGNYTFINSQTLIPRLVSAPSVIPPVFKNDTITLPQQSKHLFNAVLFYEKGAVSARIAGAYKGESVQTINAAFGPSKYIYAAANFTVDFSASYTINKKIRVFAELNNITNEPTRFFMGTSERIQSAAWYGIRGQAGINVKLY
jgi:TonB-dependent receptor